VKEAAAASEYTMLRKYLLITALAMLGIGASGCPLLMVGSLGYQGYKYQKTGKLPGQPDSSSSPSSSSTPSNTNKKSSSTPPASEIE
jgi:hypothetical protein